MFLSSHEIAQSRENALNNLLSLSAAWVEAGQRFSELVSTNSRDALQHGSRHWSHLGDGQLETITQLPATVWLDNSARISRMLDEALAIIGETHKAMIRNAESQVRALDEIIFASINRATKSSPREAEIALRAMKATLQSAEDTLHGISVAAIESVSLAEHETHQTTTIVAADKPATRKPATRRRAPAKNSGIST